MATTGARSQLIRWSPLVLALGVLLVAGILPVLDDISTSFAGYWVVARELVAGRPTVALYDDDFLYARMLSHGIDLREHFLGPPSLALTLVPLAGFDYVEARRIWLLLVLFPALAVGLVYSGGIAGRWGPAIAAGFALSPGVWQGFAVGQVYPLFLLLHLWAMSALQRKQQGFLWATAPLAVSRGWPAVPLIGAAVLCGRRHLASEAVIVGGLACLATVPIVGLSAWEHFVLVQLPQGVDPDVAGVPAYQSLNSLVTHLTTSHPVWGPDPPLPMPGMRPALLAVGLGPLAFAWWLVRKDVARCLAMAVCIELLASPFSQDYHMVLAVLPACVAWAASEDKAAVQALIGVSLAFLWAPIDLHSSELLGGWRSLLAYPRVFGVSGLALALVMAGPARGRAPAR